MAAGGKSGGKMTVNEYYLSLHYGVCQGPVIFKKITYKDKVIWQGSMATQGFADIHIPNLFGGPTLEGGVSGRIYFMPGHADQVAPDALAAKFGLTPDTCPAFRGVASLFFTGGATQMTDTLRYFSAQNPLLGMSDEMLAYYSANTESGFYWTANNPYLEGIKVEVESIFTQLSDTHAVIGAGQHNPAHMIYAALVDQSWGMGAAPWLIDRQAFLDVAERLWQEAFGLSLKWNLQDRIESFVGEILDHIQATVFVKPSTGLLSIKLLRADYDVATLPEFNPGNSKITRFERMLFGETANEVVVSWTNPENEQTETLSDQDLANVEIQGSPVSTTRDYYAIRSAALAQRILDRDLRTVSAPLASIEIETDRRAWSLIPGGVVRARYPERNIDTICRVTKIGYGKAKDSKIKVWLMEDIFALDLPPTATPPTSGWENIQTPPSPVDAAQIITIPAFFTNRLVGSRSELVYPEVVAGALASKDGVDVVSFDMVTERTDVTGALHWMSEGEKNILGRAQILTPLYQEAQSLIAGIPLTQSLRNPRPGIFVMLGSGGDASMEMALISGFDDATSSWIVERGVLDTVPRSWPVGTDAWFLPLDANIADTRDIKAAGENVQFKLLTRTSLGVLDLDDAAPVNGTMTARPHCPLRPANVKVNGTGFGKVDATGASQLAVTWSTRNRMLEDGQIVRWSEGNVTPEYLQETIITIFRQNGELMYYRKGLWTETGFNVPIEWVQEETKVFIRVSSQRGGLASIQSYGLWVENIPQVSNPAPPPASDEGPAPPPPPEPGGDPTPDPVAGIEDPPLPNLGGGPGEWT